MKLRSVAVRVVVYGGLIAAAAVAAYDLLQLTNWDGSGHATVTVTAPQAVRRVFQLKWGFQNPEDAQDSLNQPAPGFDGLLREMQAGETGYDLRYQTSGRKSGLGLWSDTFDYASWWVVFVELTDGSIWAAVVPLPDNLRKEPAPSVPMDIPDGAKNIAPFGFPFPKPAPTTP
ncbi:MAG: hypothetical protein LC104_10200 [Bacteroidales bacterium]|nr:hypothetical protein [Bacteroidales bacterium]